jgi:predicted alpha/beta-hydrolase family hydrolase
MQAFAMRLGRLGGVDAFDYAYQVAGRRAPDPLPKLIQSHRAALERIREGSAEVVLIGKSMGGRVGCHVAVELGAAAPPALVCLGYPLVGAGGRMRDEVLLALRTPILFIQGTRDAMCPVADLQALRKRMQAPNELHLVEGGDHSLKVTSTMLRATGLSQDGVFEGVVDAIARFLNQHHLNH